MGGYSVFSNPTRGAGRRGEERGRRRGERNKETVNELKRAHV